MIFSESLRKIKPAHIVFLYFLVAVVASIQGYRGNMHFAENVGKTYHSYNNYILFKNSFFHLIQGKDLYISYLDEQWDLYKYSPTFSLFFGFLAYLPDFIGLLLWNLINSIPLLIGFVQLKKISDQNKMFALLFCLIELMGNMQNAQSNGLTAALLILTFTSLENRKYLWATFFVIFSVYIKIYGGIGFVLFLFYPSKMRLAMYSLFWFLFLGLLPLMVIDYGQLVFLYRSWGDLLKTDQGNSIGISVMGVLQSVFRSGISKNLITGVGILIFLLPLIQIRKYKMYDFRILFLCSTLIWVVIFNHKAESPTYIIAVSGIAIWFFSRFKSKTNIVLVILAFIFTTLSSGDLFPHYIREEFFKPYQIKAVFSIIIFGKITWELFLNSSEVGLNSSVPESENKYGTS